MICFASISPHPPSILPSVGSESDIKRLLKTTEAMKTLSRDFYSMSPETVVVISPHIPIDFTSFSIIESIFLSGNLYKFGDFTTKMKFNGHPELASIIKKFCAGKRIPLRSFNDPQLDYGTIIPLYFLSQNLPNIKVLPIGLSGLNIKEHFDFGKLIAKGIKELDLKAAIVASADLAHRLTPNSSAGYSPKAKEFDLKIIDLLKKNKVDEILNIDQEMIEESGECGYRSIAVLLGALEGISWKPEILSYESPFGIGHLVANLKI